MDNLEASFEKAISEKSDWFDEDGCSIEWNSEESIKSMLRDLKDELASLRSQVHLLDKGMSFKNALLATLEDNKSLKTQLKALESQEPGTHKASNEDDFKLGNEVSSLRHQLDYLQEKDVSNSDTIVELRSTIAALKAENSSLKNSGPNTTVQSAPPKAAKPPPKPVKPPPKPVKPPPKPVKPPSKAVKSKIRCINNMKIEAKVTENFKDSQICFSNTNPLDVRVYFDPKANVSICTPLYVAGPLSTPPSLLYSFGTGVVQQCLGKVNASLKLSGKKNINVSLLLFDEVKDIILCKKDWTALHGK